MRMRFARRLLVEDLENRRLLAGNVTVTRSGADLFVTGDNLSNTISIESNGSGGVRVSGFNDAGGQPTRINGVANGTFQSAAFSGSVFVVMNDGDDEVRLTRLQVNTASINLGAGNDDLVAGLQAGGETRFGATAAGRLTVNQDFNIIGLAGADDIRLQSVFVGGSSVIDTGEQNDTITLLPATSASNLEGTTGRIDVGGTLTIVPGNGADTVSVRAVITGGNLVVDDAGGSLTASVSSFRSGGSTLIFGSPSNDAISVAEGHAQALLQIVSEGGNDRVFVRDTFAQNLNVNTGDGDDVLGLTNLRTPRADIQLGIGNDRVAFRQVDIDVLFAFGNAGNDVFDFYGSTVDDANIFGDSGIDTFQTSIAEPSTFGSLKRYSIERNLRA